jgi:hypothetical protein
VPNKLTYVVVAADDEWKSFKTQKRGNCSTTHAKLVKRTAPAAFQQRSLKRG